ncbi:nuclear transport factor 2 family protein [Agromyces intestinalis]|uniref:Nuclear transport factor 2 family protein n=1 Tax=Agromyces intestinalis TaxID=2592652 RepID=A0A5C1YGS5_9MICO|nr:nuclear transport factor 2 family protein [Agromyces intestinalis]QEO14818.1 nuclear transport factor 2 family protein [Agromyces intestinalis]
MHTSTASSTHPVVAAAIEALDAHDAEALAALFVADGCVDDESETHEGRSAIRRWFEATPATRIELLHEESYGSEVELIAKAHGDYPQSPLSFRYGFELEGDRIASLKISLI